MRKVFGYIILICLIMFISYNDQKSIKTDATINSTTSDISQIKQDLLSLMLAYPEDIVNVEQTPEGSIYVLTKSGGRILYDDKKEKSVSIAMENPDLQDTLAQRYPLEDIATLMAKDIDPGRMRNYRLLKEVYGENETQVRKNITTIRGGNSYYAFNSKNKAAASLKAALDEIEAVAKVRPDIRAFVIPTSGTFNYRLISGTSRLSPHAFGLAIDLRRDRRDYWQWATRKQGQQRLAEYSREVVRIFEKNNFIWGGKWEHFDILHFEYRPEIIIKSRYFANRPAGVNSWYEGVPVDNPEVTRCIEAIERTIK